MSKADQQAQAAGPEVGDADTPPPAIRVMGLTQELMRRMVALAGELASTSGLNPSDLAALRALRALPLERILPGHGPVITRPGDKLDEYLAHRLERERRLLAALHDGRRTHAELLDAAWGEVPPALRGAARITLAAHLDKLAGEHRLPAGVEGLQCPDS